jgi:uncharacterized protein (DUF2384 family)
MAALAPFLEDKAVAASDDLSQLRWEPAGGIEAAETGGAPDVPSPKTIEEEIAEFSLRLAAQPQIDEDLLIFVDRLADELIDVPPEALIRVDPYFLLAAQRATIGSLRVLDAPDPLAARNQLRIRLEQLRQVYRDLAEGKVVYDARAPKEVAAWLAEVLDVPQARLAELAGVSARTFQRWVSRSDKVAPDGEDARRLQVIAVAANHLRHALTGPGVVSWFERPNAQLEGQRPLDLLDDPEEASRLATLAASTRSHTAS